MKTPPFSDAAREETGSLLRQVQYGNALSLPDSEPMPEIGPRCHEVRIPDRDHSWRVIYRIDPEHVLVVAVFAKSTQQTPEFIKAACRARLRRYDQEKRGHANG